MSIFSKIKNAIFGHKPAAAPARPQPANQSAAGQPKPTQASAQASAPAAAPTAAPVDVEQVLASLAQSKGNPNLNYKTSIVDLMKLLDINSNLDNRKELATELGYTGDKDGSAEMNIWLHKEVMRQLAANGGKVPAGMMD